jgi:uncharacterized damage-inducible protein DinB
MNEQQHLRQLLEYNLWANEIVAGYIGNAGPGAAVLEQKSSFNTILKTVIHIWDAQSVWLDRINGITVTDWPGKNFTGNIDEALMGLTSHSKKWLLWFNGESRNDWHQYVKYRNLTGNEFEETFFNIIVHMVNHGTYHRGQLITLLRGAGYDKLGSTDFITFLRK